MIRAIDEDWQLTTDDRGKNAMPIRNGLAPKTLEIGRFSTDFSPTLANQNAANQTQLWRSLYFAMLNHSNSFRRQDNMWCKTINRRPFNLFVETKSRGQKKKKSVNLKSGLFFFVSSIIYSSQFVYALIFRRMTEMEKQWLIERMYLRYESDRAKKCWCAQQIQPKQEMKEKRMFTLSPEHEDAHGATVFIQFRRVRFFLSFICGSLCRSRWIYFSSILSFGAHTYKYGMRIKFAFEYWIH